jgi:excisionase family DNA binding protein
VPEVAEATGLNAKTIRASIARGEIPAKTYGRLIKIPRWWVEEQRSGAKAA